MPLDEIFVIIWFILFRGEYTCGERERRLAMGVAKKFEF